MGQNRKETEEEVKETDLNFRLRVAVVKNTLK